MLEIDIQSPTLLEWECSRLSWEQKPQQSVQAGVIKVIGFIGKRSDCVRSHICGHMWLCRVCSHNPHNGEIPVTIRPGHLELSTQPVKSSLISLFSPDHISPQMTCCTCFNVKKLQSFSWQLVAWVERLIKVYWVMSWQVCAGVYTLNTAPVKSLINSKCSLVNFSNHRGKQTVYLLRQQIGSNMHAHHIVLFHSKLNCKWTWCLLIIFAHNVSVQHPLGNKNCTTKLRK